MPSFEESFWGDKNNGFDVLYHNMKHGVISSKDLADFLRESCSVEENYAKLLSKLSKQVSNFNNVGTFAPFWMVFKNMTEKLSQLHLQLVSKWQEIIKELQKYNDAQTKRHKAVKENEAGTQETVASIQQTIITLQKAKETYHARCLEYEKLKRDNSSPKEIEKAETKYKKATEDYKHLLDKYATVRSDFEKKMTDSCRNFQDFEEAHLRQMKTVVDNYSKAWEEENDAIRETHTEFTQNCEELTLERLIEEFINAKATGTERPGPIEFEEADLSTLPPPAPITDQSKESTPEEQKRTGIFKKKGKTVKPKKKKKDKNGKNVDGTDSVEGDRNTPDPEIDEEGFVIRREAPNDNHDTTSSKHSWTDSSDSDSDDERKKIQVRIKPLSPTNGESAKPDNIDDIRISVGNLRLSPQNRRRSAPANDMKRSQSASDNFVGSKKPNSMADLLEIDFTSSASTPTGGPYGPYQTDGFGLPASNDSSTGSTPVSNAKTDFFLDSLENDVTHVSAPAIPLRQSTGTITSTGISSLQPPSTQPPKPAPRNKPLGPQGNSRPGHVSPLPRQESGTSLTGITFNTTSMPHGSRGPSPLTIGMSDTIPLAIAFTEQINAYFKGSDESKCIVKASGDMMVSFPAGIVKVLTENPSPAVLTFRIRNTTNVDQIILNKQLIIQEPTANGSNSLLYSFNMSSLTDLLKRQAEANKNGSYFNVDILKYQIKMTGGVMSTPLQLVTYWKCEPGTTDFRLDYKYNSSAIEKPYPLSNVQIVVPVNSDVKQMHSNPPGQWSNETRRASWKLNAISERDEGCIRAKFDLQDGQSSPQTVALQFSCEGTTLSGVEFELSGMGYRLSLTKKRFATGKYLAETDLDVRYV